MKKQSRFDLTPIGHPVWWFALGILLINDNLLKGKGLVPNWATGKLSDFAFLVVAPVLLAVLLPCALRGRRLVAIGTIAGLFVAADLSASVSDKIVAVAAQLGMRWRLWPDPSDLVALLVLPVTDWLIRRSAAVQTPPQGHSFRQRIGVVVGAFACLATSALPSFWHAPYFANLSEQPQEVTLTWLVRKVDCLERPEDIAASLNASDLGASHTEMILASQSAALDSPPLPGNAAAGRCAQNNRGQVEKDESCVGVLVAVRNGPAGLVVTEAGWNEHTKEGATIMCSGPAPVSSCQPFGNRLGLLGPEAIWLRKQAGQLILEHGEKIRFSPVSLAEIGDRKADPTGCRARKDEYLVALDAPATCRSDDECTAFYRFPFPRKHDECMVLANQTMRRDLEILRAKLKDSCNSFITREFPKRVECQDRTPVCQSGLCVTPCAGISLPNCPLSCSDLFGQRSRDVVERSCESDAGAPQYQCLSSTQEICKCRQGRFACQQEPPVNPGCPLFCNDRTDRYQSSPQRQEDGGRDGRGDTTSADIVRGTDGPTDAVNVKDGS